MKRNLFLAGALFLLGLAVFRLDSQKHIAYAQTSVPVVKLPLYRMHNVNTDQYLLTTSTDEFKTFISQGWTYEKIIGYVYVSGNAEPPNSDGSPSETALYRLHNSQTGAYLEDITASLTQQPGTNWTVDATLGYVLTKIRNYSNAQPVGIPKSTNPVENSQFLTANRNDFNDLSSGMGWSTSPSPTPAFLALTLNRTLFIVNTPGWPKQLGSVEDEEVGRVLVDHSGSIYVIGDTDGALFPSSHSPSDDCIIVKYDTNGNILWDTQFGTIAKETAASACVDSSNNLYVVGNTDSNLFGTNAGDTDAFVTKYSPNGSILWSKQFGTSTTDFANDVAVDAQDNVYVAGETVGGLFGPISGTERMQGAGEDAYIVEYDASGNQLWAKQFGDGGTCSVSRIRFDATGNIYIAGDTASLFGPAVTYYDSYVAKYSPNKTLLWGRQFGSVNPGDRTDPNGLCIDANGNVYVAGATNQHDNIDNNPDVGDGYITKFDTNGNSLWTQPWATPTAASVSDIGLDSQGNVYAVGQTAGSLFAPLVGGDTNSVIAKYDTNGNLISGIQYGAYSGLSSIAVDTQDRLYLAGGTTISLFGPCAGGEDIFIQRLNSSGQMAKALGVGLPRSKFIVDALGLRSTNVKQPTKNILQCSWAGKAVALNYPPVLVGNHPYMYIGYTGIATKNSRTIVGKDEYKQVSVVSRERQVVVNYGSTSYSLNGQTNKMPLKPIAIGKECYVPLEVIQAAVPIPVRYDSKTRRIAFNPPTLAIRKRLTHKV